MDKFIELLLCCFLLLPGHVLSAGFVSFYNDRYGDVGISYDESTDGINGIWATSDDYLDLPTTSTTPNTVHTGCSFANNVLSSCIGPAVYLDRLSIVNITNGTLESSVTSLTIFNCHSFELFEQGTFDFLTSLTSIKIQNTALNHVPDLSNTILETLNLAGNSISMNTATHNGWTMPTTIRYIALMQNQIYWIPPGMVSGPNLRMASFADNQLTQINPNIFGDVSSLVYFGAEKNQITRLSRNTLAPLATNNFKHLNLSNNLIHFVQPKAFSQLPQLTVLELHGNSFTTVQWDVFYDIPNLAHLDLHKNAISSLPSKSFQNLPMLRELRLHSQINPMTAIAYDAWNGIGDELKYLFVSDNNLPTFPHQVLEEGDYPNLLAIYADNNAITNLTEYGSEAFPANQRFLWYTKSLTFTPFSKYPSLQTLQLSNNQIQYINTTDLCNMTSLVYLYLSNNEIREAYMDSDAFACLPNLEYLYLNLNYIQYVPDALRSSSLVPAIRFLHLSGNRITFLEQFAFSNVSTLIYLSLANNSIVAIENGAFPPQIITLILNNNDFRFLHENPFTNLSSLVTLNLQENSIQYLPSTALHGCSSLANLNLENNNIPQLLSNHFRDCPLSSSLNIANNDLGYIENGTFSHSTTFGHVNLANNKITGLPMGDFQSVTMDSFSLANNRISILPSSVFQDLTISQSLSLSNNYITSIESNAFLNTNVENLYLSGNTIRYLNSYAFNTLSVSNTMDLGSAYFTTIPTKTFVDVSASSLSIDNGQLTTIEAEAFYDLTVSDLDLSSNSITVISESIFGGSSTVSDLFDMDSNGLTAISSNAFDNVSLRSVTMDSNSLTSFPQALTNQTLRYINLASNQISIIPDGSLNGQNSLIYLYLTNNMITTLSAGLLDDLSSLEYLYMGSNEITSIPTGFFANNINLQVIYLTSNNLTHFGALTNQNLLQTLGLADNKLETIDYLGFSSLPALSSLTLSSNNLECSCQLIETIDSVSAAVSSGTCSVPSDTYGVSLVEGLSTHYSNTTYVNATIFQCAGENVASSLISSKEFSISWTSPSLQFFETDPTGSSTQLNGSVSFEVTCTSTTGAATLTKTRTDTVVPGTPGTYTVNFVEADGIVPGTTYDCSVTMELDGYVSGKSSPVFLTTADDTASGAIQGHHGPLVVLKTATAPTVGPDDLVLEVWYYDFSRSHTDFQDINYVSVTNPTYVPSPYGAWLAASTTPSTDTFSTWFRYDDVGNNNYEINDTLILVNQADSSKLYWSDSFFPVDGRGYTSESQQDCSGTFHNFGFTSAIRAGLVYAGTEVITVGGGDALWLFINKVQMFEFISNGSAAENCFVLDLSTATSPGGSVTPQIGTLSSGACSSPVAMSTSISLEMEVGVTYHFDLFHAETRLCSSEFLLHVQDTTLSQDFSSYAPLDYDVTISEDIQVGEIVTAISLSDDFSVGSYNLVLESGNEARHFDVKDSSYNTFTPTTVILIYTNMTDIDGNPFAFVECTASSPSTTTNDPSSESFAITTTSAQVVLKADVDYETMTSHFLRFTVVDSGKSLTGNIAVRIKVQDVNDNCPQLSPTSLTLSPEPVLQVPALATFTTSDADSGENGNVYYIVSEVTENPAADFDDSYDLFGDVYLRYTSLSFTVVAIDNGTIPRGTTASVSMNVSNTCVIDVQFGKITYVFHVNTTTGELTFRVPKYWMYEFTCSDLIGLVSGHVLDFMLSASSSMDDFSGPGRARLNQSEDTFNHMLGGWIAGTYDINQYIEVDMNMAYKFTKLFIQGRADADQWVTSFKILFYNSTTGTWETYMNAAGTETFTGNTDRTTVVTHDLDPAIFSQMVRINPQTWNGGISLRFEMSGCPQAEQLYYDVSCQRCETSYYCEGDGLRHTCGRCENTSVTCDRNPAEHSYGLASECSLCPAGRLCENGTAYICDSYYYVECTNTSCPSACSPCETGYACKDGIRTLCRAGTYSDGQMEQCTSCTAGYYQNETGQGSCTPCAAGYFSVTGMSQCDVCTNDKFSLADGSGCQLCPDDSQCPCLTGTKCHSESLCYNTGNGGYACLPCGDGLTGDGETCTDIDECAEYDPCYMSRCVNTDPGFQCLECPEGYNGTYEDALAYNISHRVFLYTNQERSNYTYQTCEDIDECASNHGGCDALMTCVNTQGGYYCDFCASGYMGTNRTGCYLDDFCTSGVHTCDTTKADCVYLGPAQFRCKCKPGYAGIGTLCGLDTDLDGRPDTGLSCTDSSCRRDNCPSVPNSNQEDTDNDSSGDNCDSDDDNDGRYDYLDNCQFVSNFNQVDSDGDGVGDACSSDTDGDGLSDASDNCPMVSNSGQADTDGDGIGDDCDNCPSVSNVNQDDIDGNSVGDACETVVLTNIDRDGDSILDSVDNCPSYMNGDQSDADSDGIGDLCDDDIDNDGIANTIDNCIYVSNSNQEDTNGNAVGDVCESDTDGDGIDDNSDTCPHNPSRQSTSFSSYTSVILDPSSTSDLPNWLVKSDGSEVEQTVSTDLPVMLIGTESYGAVEYAGTWYTGDTSASDNFGFVFGYMSNRKFYLVTWKRQHYNYKDLDQSTYKAGIQGPQLKLIDSTLGPSSTLADALWHGDDTTGHVTVLWQDPSMTGWSPATPYRWYLTHKPTTGYINLKIYSGTSLLLDSGSLYDYTISGGRLGVYQFGAFPMIWSNLVAECLEHDNHGLYLDGVDDYVMLGNVESLNLDNSFTIEAWINLDTGFTSGPYPIVCTWDGNLCFWIEGGVLKGKYSDVEVTGSISLSPGTWHNAIFRHDISSQTITLFVDGTLDSQAPVVSMLNWTSFASTDQTVYIGRDNSTFFRGTVDEIRFYSEAILDTEITSHISLASLEREILKNYGAIHFRMEESAAVSSLTNSGYLSSPIAQLSGGTFVTSYQQYHQFQIAFPNN